MDKLIHGDCLDELKTLATNSVDLVCTDPPYGDDAGYGRYGRTIVGNETPLLGLLALHACYRVLKRDRAAYFFLSAKHQPLVDFFVRRYTQFTVREWLVWDKAWFGLGRGFRPQYEFIAVLEKGKPKYNSKAFANVLRFRRVATTEHPHKKPTALLCAMIKHATMPGDIVLDPFAGSGSTCVAARMLGRRYIGIERELGYAKIARRRIDAVSAPQADGAGETA